MRIISGENKGLTIKAVPGMTTRPTTDKVRESVYQIIGPYFEGGTMLDLYGGSGVVGLEALSRGLDHVIFVDKDYKAVKTIKQNIQAAGAGDRSAVYRNDASKALKAVARKGDKFNIIFLDPPYENQQIQKDLIYIDEAGLLQEDGLIIVEHIKKVMPDDDFESFKLIRREFYGITVISIYKRREKNDYSDGTGEF
ncbi:16S rRNA (guanine(966)-N(2))-methyltransferase RsmD [Alkalicoccus halolimnae]|uniref:16S rRNA (guanine(966)-N(2))-methyltransferase RsmD n=1 Tax=Alkalicoccus halolimnae TaxID=1667239 RepID=UPI0011C71631|nr:16S rRNA (guanine(966)-N(2))-methyltransferase RsmD [Alkalicoccus halolimnae]